MNGAAKELKQQIPVPALAVLLALALGLVLFSWYRSRHVPPPVSAASPTAVDDSLMLESSHLMRSVQSRLEEDGRALDLGKWRVVEVPAATVEEAQSAAAVRQSVQLKGVARDRQHPVAFVNDRTVGIGEVIQGHQVLEIGTESVTLLDPQGQQIVLGIYDRPLKK